MISPVAEYWSLMAPRLGFGKATRPAAIEFTMGNKLDSAAVWENDDCALVGFAGTEGTLSDWAQNVDIIPNEDDIHEGFASAASFFISTDFCDYLKGAVRAGKKIKVTGISQGAAYACVVPWYLARDHRIRANEITHFGGPPWALDDAMRYLEAVCPITRVVTPHDPVPVSWLPFRREGVRLEVPGCTGAEFLPVLDHRPEVYTLGIRSWCLSNNDAEGVAAMDALMGSLA